MCRILLVSLKEKDDLRQHIEQFALKCRNSWQYQGDGFGIAYHNHCKNIKFKKSLKPIWAASKTIQSLPYSCFALVHARSAFGEETIGDLKNNQPFGSDEEGDFLMVFNGNLQGVRLDAPGKIGAHKIYNFLKAELAKNPEVDFQTIMKKGVERICKRTRYVKSFNMIAIRGSEVYVHNQYGEKEDSEYFDLWISETDKHLIISSEKLDFYEMKRFESNPEQIKTLYF